MSSTTSTSTTRELTLEEFSPNVKHVSGTPTLYDLMCVYRDMIICAQTNLTKLPQPWLALSHCPIKPGGYVWSSYSCGSLIRFSRRPHINSHLWPWHTSWHSHITWHIGDKKQKKHQEDAHMNRVLIKHYVSFFAVEHNQSYYILFISEQEHHFRMTFQYVYNIFGTQDDKELNRDNMRSPWSP